MEILHVILLGFVKYFWRDAMERLSADQKDILKTRLSSIDVLGLDPHISALQGHTLVQYAGSLVGWDFRVIAQLAIFALYDLLPAHVIEAWAALCHLIPLVYQPDIDDLDNYLVSTHILIMIKTS